MKTYQFHLPAVPLATILLLAGCMAGMVSTTQSIPSKLSAKEYNNLSAQYLDRPTFVSVDVMKDSSKVLCVTINAYETPVYVVRFFEKDCNKYIAAIDKFSEWDAKATRNGDIIDKEIAAIPEPNLINIHFIFTSGNEKFHYLAVSPTPAGLIGPMLAPAFTFDPDNVRVLRQLLVNLPNMSAHLKADDYN